MKFSKFNANEMPYNFINDDNNVKVHYCSSNIQGFEPDQLMNEYKGCLWISNDNVPQEIVFNLRNMIRRPEPYFSVFGIHCKYLYDEKPKRIEILFSNDNNTFISYGEYEIRDSTEVQLYEIDNKEKLATEGIVYGEWEYNYFKIRIIETFKGNSRCFINQVMLFEESEIGGEYYKREILERDLNELKGMEKVPHDRSRQIKYVLRRYSNDKRKDSNIKKEQINDKGNKEEEKLLLKISRLIKSPSDYISKKEKKMRKMNNMNRDDNFIIYSGNENIKGNNSIKRKFIKEIDKSRYKKNLNWNEVHSNLNQINSYIYFLSYKDNSESFKDIDTFTQQLKYILNEKDKKIMLFKAKSKKKYI